MIGKILAHYEITAKLGEGGMGAVYTSLDHKHDRRVALKTIRPNIAATLGTDRFLQEIALAAQLSHPHILPVYDSGEDHGILYYIMPLVEGETLRARLTRLTRLRPEEAIRLTQQVARALSHAHAKSIVHLDIKPENILLLGADAIVADFGLARAIDVAGREGTHATRVPVQGTPAYMSPEQASGTAHLDHRSDLYSLGCVFYEMLTGTPPFVAPTRQATITMRLKHDVQPLPREMGTWCEKLDLILSKVTARDPRERVDSAEQALRLLADCFDTPQYLQDSDAQKSLLVLPFRNTSSDPENEYFSDGLTDELIFDLSKVRGLRVISRTSSMRLKNTGLSLAEIGQELKVGYVVEGSVRKSGKSLRINCQLVDVDTDRLVWSDRHDGTLDDVFSIQERVAHAIASALRERLTIDEAPTVRERGFENVAAYDYYLRARKDIFSYSSAALDRAIEHLLTAVEMVGENVMLFRGLGMAFWQYCNAGIAPDARLLDQVDVYANAIEQLEPGSASVSTLRGLAEVQRGHLEESIRHLKNAYALEPHDPDVMLWLGACYCLAGRTDIARIIVDKLMSLDPLTPVNTWVYSFVDYLDGDFETAAKKMEAGLSKYPDRLGMCWELARFLAAAGRREDSLHFMNETFDRTPEEDSVFYEMLRMLEAALLGDRQRVSDACTGQLRRMVSTDMEYPQAIADCFSLVGDTDQAMEWLRLAVERGFLNERFLTEFDPFLETVRRDARFQELMEEVHQRRELLGRVLEP